MIEYLTIKNFLSEDECNEILNYSLKSLKLHNAVVGSSNQLNEDLRKSSISFTNYDDVFPNIKLKLLNKLSELIKIKGYKIIFSNNVYQFTKYEKGQYYEWHVDARDGGTFESRYCSVVIQLNDSYKGGDLQMIQMNGDSEEIITFEKGKGNLFVFLSRIMHRVNEVTEGTRYSLVCWFELQEDKNAKKTLI